MVAKFGTNSLWAASLPSGLEVVGRVKRDVRYRKKPIVDVEFQALLDKYQIKYDEYGYALGNLQTSFNQVSDYVVSDLDTFDSLAFMKATEMLHTSYSIVKRSKLTYDYLDWIDMSTSPGYPYNLIYKTKKDALADTRILLYVTEKVRRSEEPNGYWTLFGKAEPKKQKRIDDYDSRVVVGAPLDMQVESAYLFGIQNQYIYDAGRRFVIPSTVGMTKYYLGWHDLYRRLTRNGFTHGLEADYTKFDKKMKRREFEVVMNLRFSLYDPVLQTPDLMQRLQNYYREVIHSKIVMETGDVILKHCGNPSGQVNTITDNSIINEWRWYYLWCVITPDVFHTLDNFRKHCELVVCGDDSIISVSTYAQKYFPVSEIMKHGQIQGWNFKFFATEYKPIHLLSYCSQSFYYYFGYVLPVPNNVNKLLASLLYGLKGKPHRPREILSRVLGVRMESFFLFRFRSLLEEYINYLFSTYSVELRREPPKDMLSFGELQLMNRDFQQALSLYINDVDVDLREMRPYRSGVVQPFTNEHIVDLKFSLGG